jgi:hypothetical protein
MSHYYRIPFCETLKMGLRGERGPRLNLAWSWFVLWLLLLSSVVLASLSYVVLNLSKYARLLRLTHIRSSYLTLEPPLIVRSRTKNYKTSTKSSVLHLLVILETRNVLNLHERVLGIELRGLLSYFICGLTNHWFFLQNIR